MDNLGKTVEFYAGILQELFFSRLQTENAPTGCCSQYLTTVQWQHTAEMPSVDVLSTTFGQFQVAEILRLRIIAVNSYVGAYEKAAVIAARCHAQDVVRA